MRDNGTEWLSLKIKSGSVPVGSARRVSPYGHRHSGHLVNYHGPWWLSSAFASWPLWAPGDPETFQGFAQLFHNCAKMFTRFDSVDICTDGVKAMVRTASQGSGTESYRSCYSRRTHLQ